MHSKQIQKSVTSQNSFIGKQYQRGGNFQILWYRNALEYLGISFVPKTTFPNRQTEISGKHTTFMEDEDRHSKEFFGNIM
jgi:hypothetical protein